MREVQCEGGAGYEGWRSEGGAGCELRHNHEKLAHVCGNCICIVR